MGRPSEETILPLHGEKRDWLAKQLREWPARVDENRTCSMRYLMDAAAATLEQEAWKPIAKAPSACHVLAAYRDSACGEWIMKFVESPPAFPYTHFMMPGPPA